MNYRIESDSLGEIKVEASKNWGAQTQRSLENFPIGVEKMPLEVIYAMTRVKHAASVVNAKNGKLDARRAELIQNAAQRILNGELDDDFPLVIWQTGSGTQSNMNVNEVISNLCMLEDNTLYVHPNDHVNMGQSSNDVFPTAMHIASYEALQEKLMPMIMYMEEVLEKKSAEFYSIIKIGRTHLQDATPLRLGQEISAWKHMLEKSRLTLTDLMEQFTYLAIGGTAVGTGVNTSKSFGHEICALISNDNITYKEELNKFYALSARDSFVYVHGALEGLAGNLHKIANDIRMLSMGPRAGINELNIPINEPGSSIMPGKVNPTQAEQMTMVAARIFGNQQSISFASSQGQFQLNVYGPLIIYCFLQSVNLMADSIKAFTNKLLIGLEANESKIKINLENSLMLVTALSPQFGYKKAAEIANKAYEENRSLKDVALEILDISETDLEDLLNPEKMV